MERLQIGGRGRSDYSRNIQVALRQLRRADADRFVGKADGKRVAIGFTVYRHRADAQFLAGANDAKGDLATIGNEYFLEHARVQWDYWFNNPLGVDTKMRAHRAPRRSGFISSDGSKTTP